MADGQYTVFVSAVTSEFAAARSLVASDLRSRGLKVLAQEDFRQELDSSTTLEKVKDYVRGCDAAVFIVGTRSGAVPAVASSAAFRGLVPDGFEELSYTQWELVFARSLGTRTSIYVASDSFAPDLPDAIPDDRPALQARFRQWMFQGLGLDRSTFASIHELGRLVLREEWPSRPVRAEPWDDGGKEALLSFAPPMDGSRDTELDAVVSRLALGLGGGVLLIGPMFAGKTTVMGEIARRLNSDPNKEVVVLRNQRGDGHGPLRPLSALSAQLARVAGHRPELHTSLDELVLHFRSTLNAAGRRTTTCILIDALDEAPAGSRLLEALAARPPDDVWFIVSTRPQPIVAPAHFLRSEAMAIEIHPIAESQAVKQKADAWCAAVVDAEPALGKNVIAAMLAAGGPLSAYEIEELLDVEDASAVFRRHASWLTPPTAAGRRKLGHEYLEATLRVGLLDRVAEAAAKIEAWGDRYRAGRWPTSTPTYLLSGSYILGDGSDVDSVLKRSHDWLSRPWRERHVDRFGESRQLIQASSELTRRLIDAVGERDDALDTFFRLISETFKLGVEMGVPHWLVDAVGAHDPRRALRLAHDSAQWSGDPIVLIAAARHLQDEGERRRVWAEAYQQIVGDDDPLWKLPRLIMLARDGDVASLGGAQRLAFEHTLHTMIPFLGDLDRLGVAGARKRGFELLQRFEYVQREPHRYLPYLAGLGHIEEAVRKAATSDTTVLTLAEVVSISSELGRPADAEPLLALIDYDSSRDSALLDLVGAYVKFEDHRRARTLAERITGPNRRARAHVLLSKSGGAEELERARALVRSVGDPMERAETLALIAGEGTRADLAAAETALRAAMRLRWSDQEALFEVVSTAIALGISDSVLPLDELVDHENYRGRLSARLASDGDAFSAQWATTAVLSRKTHEWDGSSASQLYRNALEIDHPFDRIEALSRVATVARRTGDSATASGIRVALAEFLRGMAFR